MAQQILCDSNTKTGNLKTHKLYHSEEAQHKDMTTCQRVLLKLGTTHPTSQINWVWYQSAVCVLIFKEKTTSPN